MKYTSQTKVAVILLALAESFTQGQKIVPEVMQGKNLDEQSNTKKKEVKKC
jgi:hypothetical protein